MAAPAALRAATLPPAASPGTSAAAAASATPPAFLTDIEGRQALDWVHAQNARTFGVLEQDPRYKGFAADALAIAQSTDRIPTPMLLGGQVYNFWQDAQHRHGIWRRTDLASYRTAAPAWHTVLDLDALSAAEHVNWVWKGADCEEPDERRCMLLLSNGGEDATTAREFDLPGARFVPGGFVLPHSKQMTAWDGPNTLLVDRDWGPGTLTASGYPFIVKRLQRGQTLDQAAEVARGTPTDISDSPEVLVDGDGHREALIQRTVSFFESQYRQVTPHGLVPLPLPPKAVVVGLVQDRLVVKLNQAWQPAAGPAMPAGSLVALDAAHPDAPPQLVFAPGPRQSVEAEAVGVTRSRVVAAIYDDVRGSAVSFAPGAPGAPGAPRRPGPWRPLDRAPPAAARQRLGEPGRCRPARRRRLPAGDRLPHAEPALAGRRGAGPGRDGEGAAGAVRRVSATESSSSSRRRPPTARRSRTSSCTRRDMRRDGRQPSDRSFTAYGGFGVSMAPRLHPARWASCGWSTAACTSLANIRGGGEFGPAWHDAGLQDQAPDHLSTIFAAVGARSGRRARHHQHAPPGHHAAAPTAAC